MTASRPRRPASRRAGWAVAAALRRSSSGPSPTTRTVIPASSSGAASMIVPMPFSVASRPTNRNPSPAPLRGPGSGAMKFGLTMDSIGRQPALGELRRRELREGDERVDVPPRPGHALRGQHGRDRERLDARVAIAAVDDGRPGHGATDAVLARTAVSEERRGRTDGAVVVDGLDDGGPRRARRAVDGGREQRERVVDVDDLGGPGREPPRDEPRTARRPDGLDAEAELLSKAGIVGDRIVVDDERLDGVAHAPEQLELRVEDRVLAGPLPVPLVDEQDGRARSFGGRASRCGGCGRSGGWHRRGFCGRGHGAIWTPRLTGRRNGSAPSSPANPARPVALPRRNIPPRRPPVART